MDGGILHAIEHSWLGGYARESIWLYPTANVLHILTLTVFAASVAMMDARLLGAFRAMAPGPYLRSVRMVVVPAFLMMLLSGSILFTAEATHVAVNPVFLIKLALIALALTNALIFELATSNAVREAPAGMSLPIAARINAVLSLGIWLSVAAAGRLIAYF